MAEFKREIALGHFLAINQAGGQARYRHQNFSNQSIQYSGASNADYSYLPFAFRGTTTNRNGDNDATAVLIPNNSLTQVIMSNIVTGSWLIQVDTVILDPGDLRQQEILASYTGQVIGASVSGPTIEVELGSILDATGADIPRRRITEDLFGPLPTTANVRLQ
jgi:hypothetical protein